MPVYATDGSACFDLVAATVDGFHHIGKHVEVPSPVICGTGLAFEIPQGHVMLIFSRSGHGFKNDVRLANCVGVIDSDFRGEVKVKLTSDKFGCGDDTALPLHVQPGDRIAQAMVIPVQKVSFIEAEELGSTDRGEGGFGSTGK